MNIWKNSLPYEPKSKFQKPLSKERISEINLKWQQESNEWIIKTLENDIANYPSQVREIIWQEAENRGLTVDEHVKHIDNIPLWTISSSMTFCFKYIFSSLWIFLFGFGTIAAISQGFENSAIFLFAWIIGSMFIYWYCIRLKRVGIDDEFIYISNYFKTISIPLSQIKSISERVFINTHPIYITFKNETDFGYKIIFIPFFHWRSIFLMSHPIVDELYSLMKSTTPQLPH